ncbi:MAG: ergothioneine biosynthesis protein EgtB [Gammaproteobacteria bacterium]
MNSAPHPRTATVPDSLASRYKQVRDTSVDLCRTLAPEDMTVQSMPDASPAKWHLAHTTWFFEKFLLIPHLNGYPPFNPAFDYLFNSYYYTVGTMYPRLQRGLLSRPTVAEIMLYRDHVDTHIARLLEQQNTNAKFGFLITLGLNHEQQHQELLLTDIKHMLAANPLKPVWRRLPVSASAPVQQLKYISRPEGLVQIGHNGSDFSFDNETPRHRVFLQRHAMASRLVTNGEYLEFIRAGGYKTPELWLSDGWTTIQKESWMRPLYWNKDMTAKFTLGGERELDVNTPVCHVSYYEADAYARWAGAHLPTEAEWETFAADHPVQGNFVESGLFHPRVAGSGDLQLFGDVWEWTASAYSAYPGFKPLAGSLGEYNGKFMVNQMVLRGGSCATSVSHMRASYRNFFYPHQRWQFMGIRLAKDE